MTTARLFRALRRDAARVASLVSGLLLVAACHAAEPAGGTSPTAAAAGADATAPGPQKESRMWMTIGDRRFAVKLADAAAARAFAAQLPLSIRMDELNGNEKHATLPQALPANASRPGTLRSGDIMLYGSDMLVVFYVTFDSPYSYTRIGRLEDPAGLARAVGSRAVQVRFSRD